MVAFRLRKDELEWRQIDDEIVALDGRRSTYLAIDGAGVLLWPLLQTGATRDDLIAALTSAYGIDGQQAGADVDAFVADLADKGLLD